MKKIHNILFLLHDSVLNGGATRSMLDVIIKLKQENKINPIILYPDKNESMLKLLDDMNIKYYHIIYPIWTYGKKKSILRKIKYLTIEVLKHFIVYINSFKIKQIIKKHNIELIYSNTRTVCLGCYLNEKFSLPHIWHIREFGEEDHGITFPLGEKRIYRMIDKNTDKIVVISNALKAKYEKNISNKDKLTVLYDDISKDFINPKEKFNLDNKNQLNVAMIGTISEGKGQLEVIKSIRRLKNKNIKLYIAGEKRNNEYNIMIEKYIKDNGLEKNTEFVGFIKEINDFRKNMDVGIVASRSEAFGRTTIEGMLSQMLIIASNAGSNIELINDGKNGFLYELHNDKQLAKILSNINDNRLLLKEIALNGFEFAKKFTQGDTAKKVYEIITNILE